MKSKQPTRTSLWKSIAMWTIIAVLVVWTLLSNPWNSGNLKSHPHPVQSYAEAVTRIEALQADRQSEMVPDCITKFMTHGSKVSNVIVLVHGYTNCPNQFAALGQKFYDLGYNVLIAPLPHHGLLDRSTPEQGQITAEELAAYGDTMVDIAQGLGDHVTVMGLSGGGAVTAWVAQFRSDVDTAVVISPGLGFKIVPMPLTGMAMNITMLRPDEYVWWDPVLKDKSGDPGTYPGVSKHTLAQIMRLGFSVQVAALRTAPAARRVIMVTNANDESINVDLANAVARIWIEHDPNAMLYEFPLSLGLPHDLITPGHIGANIDLVYVKLIELATQK